MLIFSSTSPSFISVLCKLQILGLDCPCLTNNSIDLREKTLLSSKQDQVLIIWSMYKSVKILLFIFMGTEWRSYCHTWTEKPVTTAGKKKDSLTAFKLQGENCVLGQLCLWVNV